LFPELIRGTRDVQTMWAYDLDLWPSRSLQMSVIRILVICQSTSANFVVWPKRVRHTIDLVTLTYNTGGHGACRWCRSTSSIRTSSLKFLGLTVWKIWHILCVCISRPVTLSFDLWPLTLKLVCNVARVMYLLPILVILRLFVFDLWATGLLWRSADSPLNIADLCPAIPDMGLLYLLAYLMWLFILLRGQGRLWCSRIFVKVRLGVILVCWFWYVLVWNFRDAKGVYNGRTCGRSLSWTSTVVVAVRIVGVFVLVRLA